MDAGKRIYMAGSGGMLGEAFHRVFDGAHELRCTDKDVNADWLSLLDFRDFDAYRDDVLAFRPTTCSTSAPITSLEYCEEHPTMPMRPTRSASSMPCTSPTSWHSAALHQHGGIFDGATGDVLTIGTSPIRSATMRAANYGRKVRRRELPRPSCLSSRLDDGGGPAKDKKFIQKLMKQLKDGTRELFMVDDKLGTPTYTMDFARNVELLLGTRLLGHLQHGLPGRDQPAGGRRYLVERFGLEGDVSITPVSSDHFARNISLRVRPRSG
jgi:dTDP-4-dehydrorhamnose reductase